MAKRLTYKERAFAEAYVSEKGNGTQAALQVYAAKNTNVANTIAYDNLRKSKVQAEIDRILSAIDIDKIDVRTIAASIAEQAFDPDENPVVRLRAKELLARWKAMLTERNLNENRNIDITDVEDRRRIAAQALQMLEQADQAATSLAQLGEVEASTPKPQHDEGLDSTAQVCEDKTVSTDTV